MWRTLRLASNRFKRPITMKVFVTGFPGFLAGRLLPLLLERKELEQITVLVQPEFRDRAEAELRSLYAAAHGEHGAQFPPREQGPLLEIVEGDITQQGLSIPEAKLKELYDGITDVWHLAAVYDLAVDKQFARRVNVEGTARVLDFVKQCRELEQFNYISTAYVSGLRTGTIRENELDHNAGFKNEYEKSKYEAEQLVRRERERVPLRIFRPGIIVGDSSTGKTESFNGPYYIFRILKKLPRYTLMVRIGTGENPVNIVPVDYVVRAMDHISASTPARGQTYHLTDPAPLSVNSLVQIVSQVLEKRMFFVNMPPSAVRWLLEHGFTRITGIPAELVDYFDFPAYYDNAITELALRNSGIACPLFEEYAPIILQYLQMHGGYPPGSDKAKEQ